MIETLSSTVRSNYLRLIRTQPDAFELQTAEVGLTLRNASGATFSVDLLSTVHLADEDYYSQLQRECDGYEEVLFELIVDESLVALGSEPATIRATRRLSKPLRASEQLRTLAERNGLRTQVDSLDCLQPNWVLADVTRRELSIQERRLQAPGLATGRNTLAPGFGALSMPLRLLIVGPASLGSTQASVLRPLLYLLPAPEACLLLDDWVASGGATPAPALLPLVGAIGRFDWTAARQLSFAQTLTSGETTQEGSLAGALVRWRNARAVDEVDAAVRAGRRRVALLYGALHMRDLRSRLLQRYDLVSVGSPRWRTAWRVQVPPNDGEGDGSLLILIVLIVGLLALDAADWIECVETILQAAVSAAVGGPGSLAEAGGAATLYLGRHALLYLAIQRWAFEWDSRWWAVEAEEAAATSRRFE